MTIMNRKHLRGLYLKKCENTVDVLRGTYSRKYTPIKMTFDEIGDLDILDTFSLIQSCGISSTIPQLCLKKTNLLEGKESAIMQVDACKAINYSFLLVLHHHLSCHCIIYS